MRQGAQARDEIQLSMGTLVEPIVSGSGLKRGGGRCAMGSRADRTELEAADAGRLEEDCPVEVFCAM